MSEQTKPDRDIVDVIDAMVAVCPLDGEGAEVRQRLEAVKEKAHYTPPEMMGYRWNYLSQVVNSVVPAPPEELKAWQLEMVGIFCPQMKADESDE